MADEWHLPYRASQHPTTVIVVGRPSSGTRLVCRMIDAAHIAVRHDAWHGRKEWTSGRVLLVTRDEEARAASVEARWPDGDKSPVTYPSMDEIRALYPDALEVAYEDIVAGKDAVIVELAAALGVEPWIFDEEIYDANAEPGSREAGRPLRGFGLPMDR